MPVVVVTGTGAGVGRATVEGFAKHGYSVGPLSRYLGQVHGTVAALSRMRTRNRGAIVNVGSAPAYRSVPLRSVCRGTKAAIRGFTDSPRSEIIHDKLKVHLTVVDLPAVNTPQFDWALNKMGRRTQPVPAICQPEVPQRPLGRSRCCTKPPNGWISERLR